MKHIPKKREHVSRGGSRWANEIKNISLAYQDELLKATTDRVVVIVATALMEGGLEMFVRHFFVANGASQKECDWWLTDGFLPPFGNFGLQIKFASWLKLIDTNVAQALDFARLWRNNFAHNVTPEPLTNDAAEELLSLVPKKYSCVGQMLTLFGEFGMDTSQPRWKFAAGCASLHAWLVGKANALYGHDVPGEVG